MATLIKNIAQLLGTHDSNALLRGSDLAILPAIRDAFILVEHGVIAAFGAMYELELKVPELPKDIIDAHGQFVWPAWIDSHTHIVFAQTREGEFIDKLKGASYAEIAAKGGGILNSASKMQEASEEQLYQDAWKRLTAMSRQGTGAVEIKSGYGLTSEAELKMLRVIKKLKEQSGLIIKATFLGAHTYPLLFREDHAGYIDMIIHEMLPVIAAEKLADYIDVFCEEGFFSVEETTLLCAAGKAYGLKPKLHVNQLNSIGGIEAGIAAEAISLDHLETLTEKEVQLLGRYAGCATLLPAAAFFLRMPFQPARKLIAANAAIVLASDFNPGSSPSGNMNFVNTLACIQMKMLPEEVINASTINAAHAMEIQEEAGSIAIGKTANLVFSKPVPSLAYLFYSFGESLIDKVMIKGEWV